MKLHVNENCICCGACMSIAPDLFSDFSDGTSVPVDKELNNEEMKLAQEAIDSCPVSAISLTEINAENLSTSLDTEEELPKAA